MFRTDKVYPCIVALEKTLKYSSVMRRRCLIFNTAGLISLFILGNGLLVKEFERFVSKSAVIY